MKRERQYKARKGREERILIDTWPLAGPKRPLEYRFRARAKKHGALVIIPKAQLGRLIERAYTRSKQLELPFNMRGKKKTNKQESV